MEATFWKLIFGSHNQSSTVNEKGQIPTRKGAPRNEHGTPKKAAQGSGGVHFKLEGANPKFLRNLVAVVEVCGWPELSLKS